MYTSPCYAVLALFLVLVSASATAAQGLTQREYIRSLESVPSDVIVQYCRRSAPESKTQIDAGYAVYLSSLDKAIDTWVSSNPRLELVNTTAASQADMQRLRASAIQFTNTVLPHIKQYDAHKYCPWLATKLKTTTQQSILKLLHEYEQHVGHG